MGKNQAVKQTAAKRSNNDRSNPNSPNQTGNGSKKTKTTNEEEIKKMSPKEMEEMLAYLSNKQTINIEKVKKNLEKSKTKPDSDSQASDDEEIEQETPQG